MQVDNLYSPETLTSDGEPVVAEGDALLISGDIYCTQNTALAARTAAGCCVEVRGPQGPGHPSTNCEELQ